MKKKPTGPTSAIIVTSEEKQAIFLRLLHRCHIRAEVKLPALDIPTLYHQQVERLLDQKYQERLTPYLKAAYKQFPGNPGLLGRMQQHQDAVAHARQALYQAEGISDPNPKPVSFQTFLRLYTTGKLPLA
ncbi:MULTISPECIES: hypothetical protein [unclassified Phaeobacter]|uniref:hypothetical protein n=1 Tax=unclassified Phaeobacter TaxID=2621772 RepID=UPI003A8A6B68